MGMGGYAVLGNVVRGIEASTAWAAEAGLSASTDGVIEPRAKFEYGRRRGDTALDLSLKSDSGIDDDTGRGSIHPREGADTWRRSLDTRAIQRERADTIGWRTDPQSEVSEQRDAVRVGSRRCREH